MIIRVVILLYVISLQPLGAQNIPSDKILSISELSSYLNKSSANEIKIRKTSSEADLAKYFRTKFTERYFYNWETAETRFKHYNSIYSKAKASHTTRALDHLAKYTSKPKWKLPFNYQNGAPVNAYALRHLARQHKMVDIGYYYFYNNKDVKYLNYFTEQLGSLNTAFVNNDFEKIKDGNGVYEAFRSGYRVLNWLHLHNLFLGQKDYSDEEQLITIATLLQHGQHLYERNQKFKSGNHQTRGLSALAMLSILFQDFKGADVWYKHAMELLGQHLQKEINKDGFQFERTVHYHMSDIGNYFYVYQLAKKNKLSIDLVWENKLKSLFTTLTKIAFPDKSAPVFSDDTDTPWAEKNDISKIMALGYLLFEDPEMGYFAKNELSPKFYWNVSTSQLEKLKNIEQQKPKTASVSFPETGYYIMRQGWKKNDNMMVVSSGLDDKKPDHQHGDMLGIQAMANGQVILPNYQVRYSLKDLELFKNSMTKNVALVDNELQGKQYTSNKGGSGFGKFKSLPQPKTIAFKTNDDLDVFIGSHDGFENIDVNYSRQVISVKDDFWIVKDNFQSNTAHEYKQVWQGHYSLEEAPNILRATFNNGSGLDILQLKTTDAFKADGKRGKQWAVISKKGEKEFSFLTLVFPYKSYRESIIFDKTNLSFKGWKSQNNNWKFDTKKTTAIHKKNTSFFFSVETLKMDKIKIETSKVSDLYIKIENKTISIQLLSENEISIKLNKKSYPLKPGELIKKSIL